MATTNFEQLKTKWRELLFAYVQRDDQEQSLKDWCTDNEIKYGTARNYFNAKNIKSAIEFIAKMQNEVDLEQDAEINAESVSASVSDCSLTELIDKLGPAKSTKKTKNAEDIFLDALNDDEKPVFKRIYDMGMDLKGEIALIRFQIYRAKKNQSKQEALILDGKSESSLVLVERKDGTVKIGDDSVPTEELKYTLSDWDTVIQRLGQLLASLMSLQVKIEFGERLTADEQADIIGRVTKMVDSETITAVQASMALSSNGVKDMPLALELKMRDELSQMGDSYGERANDPQDKIDEEIERRRVESEKNKKAFLEQREKELEELNTEDSA